MMSPSQAGGRLLLESFIRSSRISTRRINVDKIRTIANEANPISQPPPPLRDESSGSKSKPLRFAVLLGLFGAGSYLLGTLYPPESILLLYPRPSPPSPLPGTIEAQKYKESLEKEMLNLPHIRSLLASKSKVDASSDEIKSHYVLSRPFANFPEQMAAHSLTAGSLRKPGMLFIPPVVISKTRHGAATLGGNQGDGFAFIHLGKNLCGHDGIIHGGLLATILDETLARTSFFHLPHKIGVTAHLEIDYKNPVRANSVVIIETKLIENEGRKAWVEATMTDLRGNTLVISKALFVEPRFVAWLDTSAVRKVMDQSDE